VFFGPAGIEIFLSQAGAFAMFVHFCEV
jgi:hypothetical protein